MSPTPSKWRRCLRGAPIHNRMEKADLVKPLRCDVSLTEWTKDLSPLF